MKALSGSDHPAAKLNEEKARSIVKEWASGNVSQRMLARKYGVNQSTIRQVLTGRAWSHATGIKFK